MLCFVVKKGVEFQRFAIVKVHTPFILLFFDTPVRLELATPHILELDFLIYSVEFREPK